MVKMKYNTELVLENITYYKYFYLSRIYHNPNLPYYILQGYRMILGIFCLFNFIMYNWLEIPEYLNIFLMKYSGELFTESNQVNMFPGSGNPSGGHYYGYFQSGGSSFGGDPSGGGPSGSGPPGGGSQGGSGDQSSKDQNEETNKSKGKGKKRAQFEESYEEWEAKRKKAERPFRGATRLAPDGKKFFFFDRPSNRAIHPETYHAEPPLCIQSNTIRQYKEHGLTYVYHVGGDHPRDFCRIWFPDGTKIEIYDERTVFNFMQHHRDEVRLGRNHDPIYNYAEYYTNHFEPFRKKKISDMIEGFKIENSGKDLKRKD